MYWVLISIILIVISKIKCLKCVIILLEINIFIESGMRFLIMVFVRGVKGCNIYLIVRMC